MAVPAAGLSSDLVRYLTELEERVAQLEAPKGPSRVFRIASASLTAANAKSNGGAFAYVTDLKTFAASDGVHWYRADTGAVII